MKLLLAVSALFIFILISNSKAMQHNSGGLQNYIPGTQSEEHFTEAQIENVRLGVAFMSFHKFISPLSIQRRNHHYLSLTQMPYIPEELVM